MGELLKAFSIVALVHGVIWFLIGVPPFDHVAYHYLTKYHPVARQLKSLHTVNEIMTAHAVSAAWQLGIFDTLAELSPSGCEQGWTREEVGMRLDLPLRGVTPLLEVLASSDYLYVTATVDKNNEKVPVYSNSATASHHLVSGLSPSQDMGPMVRLLTAMAVQTSTMKDAVVNGKTVLDVHSEVFPNPNFELFASITAPLMNNTATDMVNMFEASLFSGGSTETPFQVLDVASGSGEYGYAVVQKYPHAHVTMTDYPEILEITKQNGRDKEEEGAVGFDRVEFVPGNIMTNDRLAPKSFHVVLIPNLIQMWSADKSLTLLRKVYEWTRPGGHVLLVEICRKEEPYSIWEGALPPARTFGMMGLYMSEDAKLYTLEELQDMLEHAGFINPQHGGDSFPFACFVTARKPAE